ncbi:MAG: type I-B CRISPR-associated protein Cas7/Csh2 [Thermoplasmata archaeon]
MEVKNRSEIIFLYDIRDANPNGDPLDENKPRIDEETEINIVTDVRLKRTIRDYLYKYKGYNGLNGKDIFIRENRNDKGELQDSKQRAKDFDNDLNKIREQCIDVRLFGGTIPISKPKQNSNDEESGASITFTGPVQFKFGRSMHKVEIKYIKGTAAFATKEGKTQKGFREEYILPYSLISFYGIINENSAKETKLSEEDIDEMLDAMWNGTKNLISRTKVGQMPRLLFRVIYREKNYHIGDLDKKILLVKAMDKIQMKEKDDKELRGISDFKIDLTNLYLTLENEKERIERIEIEANQDVIFLVNGNEYTGRNVVEAFKKLGGVLKPLDK